MASERFDLYIKQAESTSNAHAVGAYAQLAAAEALGRIADVLEAAWQDVGPVSMTKERTDAQPD